MTETQTVGAAELEELRGTVREFLTAKAPVNRTLELIEEPCPLDPGVHAQLADQLALPALGIPEEYGGQGYGFRELGIALEETGHVLYPAPFLSTAVLAPSALLLSGDEAACARHLPGIASGETTATVALFEPGEGWALDASITSASNDGDAWSVTGTKAWVLDGCTASLALVSARCDDGVGLFAVDLNAEGAKAEPVGVLDLTRPMATVRFEGAPATRIGGTAGFLPALIDHGLAAVACEQAGAAKACVEITTAYVAERIQFGRPIGTYQSVRHRCADMFAAAEMAGAAARNAARAIAENDPDTQVAVGVAKSFCSEALMEIAEDTVQLHGGIGFTWEHPAHLYFKRAKASALLFGDPKLHRDRIAGALLNPEAIV